MLCLSVAQCLTNFFSMMIVWLNSCFTCVCFIGNSFWLSFIFCTEVLYTSWTENTFFQVHYELLLKKWDLFYFHLSQPKLDLYSFCTLFSCTYGIVLLVLNCNLIQRKAFKIWCHDSTCGSSVSGVTLPCYVELISYNVLELKFFLWLNLFTTK